MQVADAKELAITVRDYGPIDVVLNHLGGAFTDASLSVLRRGGRMVTCGRTASRYSEIDTQELFLESKRIIGSTMGTQDDLRRIVDMVEASRFTPPIYEIYALADAGQAFADTKPRDVVGKLVVTP